MSAATLAQIARLHYVDELSKQEIGRRLGLSRFQVARLLERARAEGIVRFEIADPVPAAAPLSRALEERFGLDLALVVAEEAIPAATAGLLPGLLGPDDVLGVAWGQTVSAVVDALPAAGGGTPVVQICGALPGLEPRTGPTEVAVRLAERIGGPLHALPAPAFAGRAARDELLDHEAVRPTVERFHDVTVALVGIGVHPDGGHVLATVFDTDGHVLDSDLSRGAIAMSAAQLRGTRAVAVAGGETKGAAVRGAVRSGLLSVLVTDTVCAEAALA
jgi:DNA-binding transcriptional regulator LsrR (DeoR family)